MRRYVHKYLNKLLRSSRKRSPKIHYFILKTAVKWWPRVDLGGHKNQYWGWVALDLHLGIDLVKNPLQFIEDESLTHVMSHHFFEHISYQDGVKVVQKIKTKMKPGAIMRIVVPDKYDHVNERSLMAHDHAFSWSYQSAVELSETTGMHLDLIHWYDENKAWHENREPVKEWSIDTRRQELVTENGIFKLIKGTGRVNPHGGTETPENSLFFQLIKD